MYAVLSTEVLPQMIPPGSVVLAAVSGGPDSVALAHVIYRYIKNNKEQNLSLVISHVNHGVRKEAAQEAELVKSLARKWAVPVIIHEFKAKEYAASCQKSFQEAAREWRYARWQEDMEKFGCTLLATAHHLGDQAETVLYRLLRGSGTAGLAGIYPAKDRVIRPLLAVAKEEIMEYCQREGLPYALDKSNFEPLYDRNRIRLELLPQLAADYNERIQEALGRTAELLRWDEEYINCQVERLWPKYCRNAAEGQLLISYRAWDEPEAILSRLLRRAAAQISGEPRGLEYKFIKLLLKEGRKKSWRQDLPGLKVEASREGLLFLPADLRQGLYSDSPGEGFASKRELLLTLEKWHPLPAFSLRVGIFNHLDSKSAILWWTEFDKNTILKLKKPLICRARRPGDRMYFANLGHKTIKKVFQDKLIPEKEREQLPLITLDSLVIWIPGVCRSDSLLPVHDQAPKLYGIVAKYER